MQIPSLGRVGILCGGLSPERSVSLDSAENVCAELQAAGVDVFLLDLGEEWIAQLQATPMDIAFILVHGGIGENGHLQAALKALHIPYVGTGVLGCALSMDKLRSKWIWEPNGIPTAAFALADNLAAVDALITHHGYPVVVKPNNGGSSVGVSIVQSASEFRSAVEAAQIAYPEEVVLVEQYIRGREFSVTVFGNEALPAVEIIPNRTFYDYQAKYIDDTTRFVCPAALADEERAQISDFAVRAFRLLNMKSYGRMDFLRDESGNFYVIEANSVPGMTSHSLVPMAVRASGRTLADFLVALLLEAKG